MSSIVSTIFFFNQWSGQFEVLHEIRWCQLILQHNNIMSGKTCCLAFDMVNQDTVEEMLLSLSDETSPGIDNPDGNILKTVASLLSKPICYTFNGSLLSITSPEPRKESKIIPLPKDGKAGLTGSNCRTIKILPVLEITFNHIWNYFSRNGWLSIAQYAYRPGLSTSTALAHMIDQWISG